MNACRNPQKSLGRWRRGGCRVNRNGQPVVPERAIQRSADLADGYGAVDLLAVDEQRGRGTDPNCVTLLHGSLDRAFVLPLYARLQFHGIKIMLLPLQKRQAAKAGKP